MKRSKQLKRSPLRRRSKKRARLVARYTPLATMYLKDHSWCQVCGKAPAFQIHHRAGRIGERLNDVSMWLAVCLDCHDRIHRHGAWAREQGYLI
jgi:hypothetical protein